MVWPTLKELRRQIANDPKVYAFNRPYTVLGFDADTQQDYELPVLGELHFSLADVNMEQIAHEATHLALVHVEKIKATLGSPDVYEENPDEHLCYSVGYITAQLVQHFRQLTNRI